jgi:hypothetical protein
MKNLQEMTAEDLFDALKQYEKRFGECPVDVMDGGGPEAFFAMIKKALINGTPVPNPYADLPDGVLIH